MYLESNEQRLAAIDHIKGIADLFEEGRGGSLKTVAHINEIMTLLGPRCMTFMNENGIDSLTLKVFANLYNEIETTVNRVHAESTESEDAAPWPDEPRLRKVNSLAAISSLTTEDIKVFLQPAAMQEYDSQGNKIVSLKQKFDQRVQWLQAHPDVVLETKAPTKSVPEGFVEVKSTKRSEEPRIAAIRQQIDDATSKFGWSKAVQSRNKRLNATLNHLLDHPGSNVYVDRSTGGSGTIYRGLDAVERLMAEAINSEINGSIR